MVANRHSHGLHYALLVSLALHALALFAFTDWWEPARRVLEYPTILVARLMAPEPAPPPPAPPIEKPAPAKPKAAEPLKKKTPASETAVTQAPSMTPLPPAAPTPAPPAGEPSAPTAPVAAARPTPAPAPAAPSADAVAEQTADRYRMTLIETARVIKERRRYPPQAFENNWRGEVAVGISIGANGRASISVKRSSRYEVLDRDAVEIFEQALREVPLPSALRGKELVLKEVTVDYRVTQRERAARD